MDDVDDLEGWRPNVKPFTIRIGSMAVWALQRFIFVNCRQHHVMSDSGEACRVDHALTDLGEATG